MQSVFKTLSNFIWTFIKTKTSKPKPTCCSCFLTLISFSRCSFRLAASTILSYSCRCFSASCCDLAGKLLGRFSKMSTELGWKSETKLDVVMEPLAAKKPFGFELDWSDLILCGSMRLTHKKTVFIHTNFVYFFEAVNYHTKTTKKTKQSAFHTDLVNWHTKK